MNIQNNNKPHIKRTNKIIFNSKILKKKKRKQARMKKSSYTFSATFYDWIFIGWVVFISCDDRKIEKQNYIVTKHCQNTIPYYFNRTNISKISNIENEQQQMKKKSLSWQLWHMNKKPKKGFKWIFKVNWKSVSNFKF